jgi:hypothetical protein
MDRTRRRFLAAVAVSILAPLASGSSDRPEPGPTTRSTDATTTATESTATDAPPTTEPCTTPASDLVSDLAVEDDRENQTPFTITITRSDGTVVYESTYESDEPTGWNGRLFDEATYYTVEVTVEDGPSASEDVSVTGEDWMRRYGVYVVVEASDVSISTYHGDPVCP